ncbi:coiled-coil domain-containing protein 150 isoform 5-T5 [Chlamydotis macqueenii]
MARPTIVPASVRATAPEAFTVLQLRMSVVEEQTSALLRDLEALGVDGQRLDHSHSKASETPACHPAISPVQARVAFVGENTLWKNCETLVNRMCRLESVVQTLKLNVFRLQTEKELNPKHAAQLEQRLNAVHEEHLQEMKIVQQETMKLHQHLSDLKEAGEKAKEEVQRLSAALEITTASKMDVVIEAEELRNTNQKISCRLQELTEQLSQEICLRESLEESQAAVMCHVQDMETTVQEERKQVQILQQDCQELRKDVQLARVRLQEDEERTAQLEQQCTQLKAELDSRNCIISQLGEEAKNAQLSFSKQSKENLQLQSKMTALQETAEKVQVLNDHLSQQCSELSTTLQSVAMENAKLSSDHQTMLKIRTTANEVIQERNRLEVEKTENELEVVSLKFTLQTLEEENRRLLDHLAALAHEQYAQQQVQQVLAELTDSKNKLALDKGKLQMANLQHQLDAAKDGNTKVTAILEHALTSHKQMQAALDAVQTELRHKDTEISNLRKDKSQMQQKIQSLETELEHCRAKLVAMGRQHRSQVKPLCKALESARMDKKLVLRLEEVLQVNNTLQSTLMQTQYELKNKETEHQQLMISREQLMEKAKAEEKMYAEHLGSLKKQFQTEREAFRKAACQKSAEVKRSLEESSSKLAEVSCDNKELRQKVIELEKSLSSYREQLISQRAQVRQCLACKANTERAKETESELRKMEAMKEEYQKNNYEQLQDIQKFVSEFKSVQSEIQVLLNKQHQVQVQNRQLETQLEAERRQRQQLENECQKLEKTVKHLKKYKQETEKKLKEASIESEQITTSLEAAHHWFKSKFDSLQLEIVKNHQPKNSEESSSKNE